MNLARLFSIAAILLLLGCQHNDVQPEPQACNPEWFQQVDDILSSGDGQGHGPDLGSDEWRSVIEFKLGLRGKEGIPPRSSQQWCTFIAEHLTSHANTKPPFSCENLQSTVATLICQQPPLAALDRQLAAVYQAAAGKAQQRGWIKDRNERFWEHQQQASITWGYNSPQWQCQRASLPNNSGQ